MNEINSKEDVCNAVLLCLHVALPWLRTERALVHSSSGMLQRKAREHPTGYGMIQMCRETFDLLASGVRWWIAVMSCCLVFYRKFRACKHADNLRSWSVLMFILGVSGNSWSRSWLGVNMHIRFFLFFFLPSNRRCHSPRSSWHTAGAKKKCFFSSFSKKPATMELHLWMDISLFLVSLICWSNG